MERVIKSFVVNALYRVEDGRLILDFAPHSLYTLDLSRNQITSLEGVTFLEGTSYLDLSHNQITSLEGVTFLEGTSYLDLSHNQITSLEDVEFQIGRASCRERV